MKQVLTGSLVCVYEAPSGYAGQASVNLLRRQPAPVHMQLCTSAGSQARSIHNAGVVQGV